MSNIIDIPTEKIEGFRLSPQQKRVWLLQQSEKNNPYQVKCALVIEGLLDIDKLKQAWQQVIDRHEILRTYFKCLAGINLPLQVIDEDSNLIEKKFNLTEIEVKHLNKHLDKFFQSTVDNIFLSLVTISQQKHLLLISLPALYGDTYSLQTLVTELSFYYSSFNSDPETDNEPMQYADFAEWQNELLEEKNTKTRSNYWERQDFSSLLNLKLPWEKLITDHEGFQPQVINSLIKGDRITQILNLTKEEKISISSFLLTCWQILIYRLTNQIDLVIGTAFDGRKYEELESAIGLITQYLPIKNHLETNSSSQELWQRNHTLQQEAYQWQEYFSWDDDSVFFPVTFEFERDCQLESTSNISLAITRLYSCIDRFKLKLACQQKDDSLMLSFYYDANLFELTDIQRLAEQFNTLVINILKNPNLSINQLEILSEAERQQILIDFNQTNTNFSSLLAIQQRFEQQVAKTPNAIAVIDEERQLTYQQLNQKANQLAHYLRKQEVTTENLVALYLERSVETIICILAILKAGAAYVPLDSNLPPERLALMLQDTQAKVILTQEQLASNLLESTTANVICLDSQWEIITQESDCNLDCINQSNNLAYVIYTSGSTGIPKGVAIEHQQIINYLNSIVEKLNCNYPASFAMVSTLAADLGNTMIFPALCTGGCLHLISYDCATDGEALEKYFQQHQIDYLKITPSHLTALLSSSQPEFVLPCRTLILGGEILSWALVSKIRSLNPNCAIVNHYGPTETTVGVLTYEVKKTTNNHNAQTVPLGSPLANTQIYILDEHLQPLPIGVAGEIYIGGMQVGRGYLNCPKLTQEKFIPNPVRVIREVEGVTSEETSDVYTPRLLLYKTGDKARYLPDGNIEFLGRIDNQVKIRGFRIELEEIEAILEQHSAIQQAVVIFQADNQRLTGYIIAKTNLSPPNSGELRDFLAAKLPEYAIPLTFICLKQFPLTANGKIARDQLPTPEAISPELTATYVAPQTATEKAIAEIWLEILDVQQVGIHDNFFELGGHSLLATQIVSRIRQALQTELSLRQFFDFPTVAGLATIIAQNLAMETDEEVLATMLAELEQLPESVLAEEGENE